MSTWRNIWHDAVDANSEMMNDIYITNAVYGDRN